MLNKWEPLALVWCCELHDRLIATDLNSDTIATMQMTLSLLSFAKNM